MKIRKFMTPYILIIFFCLVSTPMSLFGYDNKIGDVHDTASKKAWDKVIAGRNFLQDLGLAESDLLYEGKRAKDWVARGSRNEDEPIIRSVNHFYDPVQKIGLNDPCGFPNLANIPIFPSPSWGLGYVPLLNAWDIKKARGYEYIALTGKELSGSSVSDAQDDTGRKKYFAHMFRAVGQVMHLVEDCAVPEHVRNDAHAFPWDRSLYEAYATTNKGSLNYSGYPLVKFPAFDCYFDTSSGTCGFVADGMGLAEFTNRNFVSQSTNFDDRGLCRLAAGIYSQPQPEFSRDEEETVSLPGGGAKNVWVHYVGNTVRDFLTGEAIENPYLSAYSWWNFETEKLGKLSYSLSKKCFKAAAEFVVPRAVGYSAGLLDYFFRGKLEMAPSEDGEGYVIENKTEEDMDGTFELYYDATDNQRKQCWSGSFALGTLSSGNNKSDNITFTTPDDAKEAEKYILVFQGRLGNEDSAVVAGVAEGGEVFCIATQTVFSATVPGYGQDNAVCISGGEIVGVTLAGEVPARNSTLEIHHTGSGTFKINGVEITDHVWAYDTWYAQTGWPATWEIQYSVLGTGWTPPRPYEGVIPSVAVKQGGEADIILWPFVVNYTLYGEDILSPGTREYGWWASVDHWCSGGKHFYETWWSLYRSGEEWTRRNFWLSYKDGGNFLSSNFPTGTNRYHSPYPYTFQGAILPEYGVENCKWGGSAGIWYSTPWGLNSMRTVGIWDAFSSIDKFFQHSIESYFFGTEEWENAEGICPEDTGLTPTLCSMEYPYDNPPEGNPITISMFKCYWKITGSSLETLFLERGYPLIERQFNLQIEGVTKELL